MMDITPVPGNDDQTIFEDLLPVPQLEQALLDIQAEESERLWLETIAELLAVVNQNEVPITPGNGGKHCLGNGGHCGRDGNLIPIQCDECDYQICCLDIELCDKCFAENGTCEVNARHLT